MAPAPVSSVCSPPSASSEPGAWPPSESAPAAPAWVSSLSAWFLPRPRRLRFRRAPPSSSDSPASCRSAGWRAGAAGAAGTAVRSGAWNSSDMGESGTANGLSCPMGSSSACTPWLALVAAECSSGAAESSADAPAAALVSPALVSAGRAVFTGVLRVRLARAGSGAAAGSSAISGSVTGSTAGAAARDRLTRALGGFSGSSGRTMPSAGSVVSAGPVGSVGSAAGVLVARFRGDFFTGGVSGRMSVPAGTDSGCSCDC